MRCEGHSVTFETRREAMAVMAALDEWRMKHGDLETLDNETDVYRGVRWLEGFLKLMEW